MGSSSNWTLDQLKGQLAARKGVRGWAITQEHAQRRERYFLMDGKALGLDQDRDTRSEALQLRLMVELPGKPNRQGEVVKKLTRKAPLAPQLESAFAAALQTDHQAWELPKTLPSNLPALKTADPRVAEDIESVVTNLTQQIRKAVLRPRKTEFSSSELFVSMHHRELHLSNGLVNRSMQSRVYVEAAYSMSGKDSIGKPQSEEYLSTQWSVSVDDLPIEKLFDETSDRAEHSLNVVKPKSGRYPVIVDAEVAAAILNPYLMQFSGINRYQSLPSMKPGDEVVAGATGDLLTMTLDPSLDFGADTATLSDQGITQKPLKVVDKNKVVGTIVDAQYAQYLGEEPTTVKGNLIVEPGTLTVEEMRKSAPQVLEVLQFSSIFPDPNSGTFSSEIRLARLYDNVRGTVEYLKGGSLSGSLGDNFQKARFSKNRVKRSHFDSDFGGHGYFGPDYLLLSDVSVIG